jgi:glycosyltransferase involved in cell wall biosynthesis
MELKIIDTPESTSEPLPALGGTELMMQWLESRIEPDLLSKFQIIPTRVRKLDDTKKKILWIHDLSGDPECTHLQYEKSRERFDKIVFCSHWQMQQFIAHYNLPLDNKITVLENAVEPFPIHDKPKDVIRLVYFTTPHRGLQLLYPVFENLATLHDNIELDVFSSFKIYGRPESDEPFKEVFDKLKAHPKINYHGTVSNAEIREHLKKSHILAYPSIWPETSCIQLIEAMCAGLLCVHPNFAALPDTAGGMTAMYDFNQDPNIHANRFRNVLHDVITNFNAAPLQDMIKFGTTYANVRYNWNRRALEWKALLKTMLET